VKNKAYLLALLLIAVALSMVEYRVVALNYPPFPKPFIKAWQIAMELRIRQTNPEAPISVVVALPANRRDQSVVDERMLSGSLAPNVVTENGIRQGIWSGVIDGEEELIRYEATIVMKQPPSKQGTNDSEGSIMKLPPLNESEYMLLQHISRRMQSRPPLAQIMALPSLKKGLTGTEPQSAEVGQQWLAFQAEHGPERSLLYLLDRLGLPRRQAEGLILAEGMVFQPVRWVEVSAGQDWIPLDLSSWNRHPRSLHLLTLARNGFPVVSVSTGATADIRWSIGQNVISPWRTHMASVMHSDAFLNRWSLFSLPPEFQATVRIFLLVPVGALMVCILRNIVGLPTFGIFMPVLMALAFRNTGLFYGLCIFGGVIFLGYAVRRWINSFRLLLVPRLSAMLTLVVTGLVTLALVGNYFGYRGMMAIGLLPIVILTMTIERFYVLVEESGARQAFITTAGSTVVSVLTYWLLNSERLQLQFFIYPELLFAVGGLQILIGRYTGYRISEYLRFRAFRNKQS